MAASDKIHSPFEHFKSVIRSKWMLLPVGFMAIALLFRNAALQYVFDKTAEKINARYGATLSAGNIRFSGIDEISANEISLHIDNDTLLRLQHLELDVALWPLLQLKMQFNKVAADSLLVDAHRLPERNNLSFLNRQSRTEKKSNNSSDFLTNAKSLERRINTLFHTALELHRAQLRYTDSSGTTVLLIPVFRYDLDSLHAVMVQPERSDTVFIDGTANISAKHYQLSLTQTAGEKGELPVIGDLKKLKVGCRKLQADIQFEVNREHLTLHAKANVDYMKLNHWRLSADDVLLKQMLFDGSITVKENSIVLDSSSYMLLNAIRANVYVAYNKTSSPTLTLQVQMPDTKANDFFGSLPDGMFHTLRGISCTGTLQYHLDFMLPLQMPDSLIFHSELKRKNFSIQKYGAVNYSSINEPFVYTAYDKDRPVRTIHVGPANRDYTPLSNISPFLTGAVLQSEDPSFMQHRGFYEEAFRESIIKNFKEKRFARGGSTISMQLVKNVFLNRNKTISRKAEEALIVYLIENLGLVGKERMLEIYLNVIEWGPNVYGIGEASRFYFNKNPSALTLPESVFLSGIIPAPKYFRYRFTKDGRLRADQDNYFRIITERMVMRGRIQPSDTIGATAGVLLKGPALQMIVPADTMDAMPQEEE